MTVAPTGDLLAAGSYGGNVGIYGADNLDPVAMLYEAHPNGVSQVLFSSDGNHLYTGGRKDQFIHCWDIRNTLQIVFSMERPITNNQRMFFSIDSTGRYLSSGLQDGTLKVFDLFDRGCVVLDHQAHSDCTNAASFHPYLPLLATSSGQRHFEDSSDSSDEGSGRDGALPFFPVSFTTVLIWRSLGFGTAGIAVWKTNLLSR